MPSDHFEDRQREWQDSEGRTCTETYQERVNTSSASTSGSLASVDVSPTFVPFRGRKNVVIQSKENITLDPSFVSAYNSRKAWFYNANKRDTHQDTSSMISIPGLVKLQHYQWVAGALPCWLSGAIRNLASLLGPVCGPCWLFCAKKQLGMRASYPFAHFPTCARSSLTACCCCCWAQRLTPSTSVAPGSAERALASRCGRCEGAAVVVLFVAVVHTQKYKRFPCPGEPTAAAVEHTLVRAPEYGTVGSRE